jgi:hypothetical protein
MFAAQPPSFPRCAVVPLIEAIKNPYVTDEIFAERREIEAEPYPSIVGASAFDRQVSLVQIH